MTRPIAGIFVGGASSRMGTPKPLLRHPAGGTLIDHWLALAVSVGAQPLLVGVRPELGAIACPVIADARPDVGPLGGLVALLRAARGGVVLALACDMPHVSATLLRRLLAAPPAVVVAPRLAGHWEPLCARYDAGAALPVAEAQLARGELSLQRLLNALAAAPLQVGDAELAQLHDWDEPADMR